MYKKVLILLFMLIMLFGCSNKEDGKYLVSDCVYSTPKDVVFPTNVEYVKEDLKPKYGTLVRVANKEENKQVELVYYCLTDEGIEEYKNQIVSLGFTDTTSTTGENKVYSKEDINVYIDRFSVSNKMVIVIENKK